MKATTCMLLACLFLYATAASAQTIEQIEAYERRIDEQQQQLDAMREELEALKQLAGLQSTIDTDSDDGPFVLRRSENGVLSLSGRVHRVVMQVDDGASRNGFFMDSDQGPQVLRVDASTQADNGWKISGALEVGYAEQPFVHG